MATHDEVRILIVEDETFQALVMREILEGELGACVDAAACCADARGKLAAGEYDIVTLDYQLPDGNGLELLQDIVDKDDAPTVIMVTGHGDEEVAATALGLGAFGYVVKDNRMPTLLIDSVTKATVRLAMQRTERALREREAVLKSAIETMTDLFFMLEPEGKLVAWNKRVEDLLGYSGEELSSLNIIEGRAGADRQAMRDGIDLALGSHKDARYELELIAKDGRRIPFEFTGAVVSDDEGGTIGITGIGRDITERRNSEVELRASEERYRAIVEDQTDLVCRFDPGTYRLTYVNEAYARCFDMEREELLGNSFLTLVDEEDRADVVARISASAKGGEVGIVEERIAAPDGEVRWQQWMNRPIQGPDGEVVEIQAVGRDITELKRAHDEVEAQRDLALGAAGAGSLGEVLELCLEAAIRVSGMDSGGIYLVDEPSGQYVLRCTSGLSDSFIEAVERLEASNEEFKLAAGGMPDYMDLETVHSPLYEVEAREGLKAAGVIPVVHEGEVIACVNVASHTLDSFPLWGRGPLEAVAAHIGLYVANEVVEAKMRASEERFQAAFLHAPDIMAVAESKGGMLIDVNHAFCEATGFAREDVIGRSYMELDIMPAYYDHERLVRYLEKEGQISNLSGEYHTRSGAVRRALYSSVLIAVEGRSCVLSSALDVTDLEEAREAARRSEEQASFLIENALDILAVLKEDGTVVFISPSVEEVLGYSPAEMLGANIFDFVHPDDLSSVLGTHRMPLEDPAGVFRAEHRALHKDGSWRIIESVGKAVLDGDAVTGVLLNSRDVTERGMAEQLIEAEARRAGLLAEVSKELAGAGSDYLSTLEVIARSIVSGSGDICGICLEAEEGGALDVVVVEHKDPEVRALLRELMADKDVRTVSGLNFDVFSTGEALLVPDFDFKNVLEEFKGVFNGDLEAFAKRFGVNGLIIAPMRAEGRSVGTLWVQRGTAERPFTESDLALVNELADRAAVSIEMARMHGRIQDELLERRQREEELEALNRELKGFAHTVSHDLKGPMSTMKLGLELLKERSDALSEEDSAEAIDSLLRNAGRSYALIENLLALAESGQVPRTVEDVNMLEMVNRVVEDNRAELDRRGVLVRLDNEMGTVRANPTQIYQLFSNLILNAVRHNDSENPELAVSYSGDDEDGMHRYRVSDNGPGIPEAILDRIFEPFVRREGGGTGIGLAIVLNMIKVYGGAIGARNNGGACFEFTIGDFPPGRD